MERKTAHDFDQELLILFDAYVHGAIDRRGFLDKAAKYAVGGVTAAMLLDQLSPKFLEAQVVKPEDSRIKVQRVEYDSPKGYGKMRGYLAQPAKAAGKLPAVLVIHENRGLNPHIEDVARRFALAGFMAFAPDGLSSAGGFPGDDYRGGQMFSKIDGKKMFEDMVAAALWLKGRADCTGKIGVTGFCYGGSVSNNLAVRLGADLSAAAPFYGGAPTAKEDVAKIKAAILVHHGELDTRLAQAWPAYDALLKEAGVTHEGYIYPGAVHGFHCDATPERYNKAAADLAWGRTVDWFNKHVRA